ncbi:hypothetical protein SAMN05216190_11026 [Pseudomonas borbori]|uniref:Uncharacterized protein n=1 Tax=Pseudomonas borbori TaxID=289003 RepID=A0A1I5Q783_9PSED|nr:hypothetical protein SAMN05216190_11026 [Pseudomonas borbori]
MSKPTTRSSNEVPPDEKNVENLADDIGWRSWRSLAIEAQGRFYEMLLTNSQRFPGLVDYAVVERARAASGTPAWSWGAAAEIQETINSVNAWGMRLHEWASWNLVVDSYESEEDRREVLHHFVEPLAFFCMLQPSAVSDRLMLVSEALLHQANCHVFPEYSDRLDQDSLKPRQTLRRSDRRKQASRLGKNWTKFGVFRHALDAINSSEYKIVSRNFRDLSVHSFAPRLMMGQILRAIRSIAPRQEIVAQPSGGYLLVDHPTKKSVQYEMVAVEPFPLGIACSASLAEYQKALAAMSEFSELVSEICDSMDAASKHKAGIK